MEKHINLVFWAILLAAATVTEAKSYRYDYEYNWHTDAFYKLHTDAHPYLQRAEVCALEGAELMPPMSQQELAQVHITMNQHQPDTEDDCGAQQHDPAEGQTLVDLETEAQDVLEMSCRVTTRDGYVTSHSVVRDTPFVCKVQAKDVPYDPQCRVHARGYRFIPSVGSCYKVSRVALTWRQAAAECQAEGAHLAVINSHQESLELKNILTSVKSVPNSVADDFFIIGFRAVTFTEPRKFMTIFNQTLEEAGYSTWLAGEPNNVNNGTEHCGSIYKEATLNDTPCNVRLAFICEKEVIESQKKLM